ncbi:unnamed protein product [Urochloa humidicola]
MAPSGRAAASHRHILLLSSAVVWPSPSFSLLGWTIMRRRRHGARDLLHRAAPGVQAIFLHLAVLRTFICHYTFEMPWPRNRIGREAI